MAKHSLFPFEYDESIYISRGFIQYMDVRFTKNFGVICEHESFDDIEINLDEGILSAYKWYSGRNGEKDYRLMAKRVEFTYTSKELAQ